MNSIASLVLSGWALAVPAAWSQSAATSSNDPFDGPDPFVEAERLLTDKELEKLKPKMIRVQVEYIELPHEMMSELMSAEKVLPDHALRMHLRELSRKKEDVRVIETQLVVARPGQKATSESIEEYIYPTEYEPAILPNEINVVKSEGKAELSGRDFAVGPTPTAFETRNLGSTLEIQPDLAEDEQIIDLKLAPELVYHVKNETWAEWKGVHGDSPIQMPIMYSMRLSAALTLRPGKYRLAGAISPKGPEGHPDYGRKVMIFVRADIVTVD